VFEARGVSLPLDEHSVQWASNLLVVMAHQVDISGERLDDVFEGVLGAATLAFSRMVGWVDRYLVDGVLNVLSAWTLTTGDEMRSIQTGRAQDYVYGLAVGLLILLLWVSWALA